MNSDSGLTRRSLLCAGASAGAAVVIGVRPWAAAAASAAGAGYLTRSAYAGLEGTSFTVETGAEPVVLRLESVADVAGAATRRALAGSDDAFALTFSGPLASPLDSGIHTLNHPRLGSFELFASPVDRPDAKRAYEIVVDRALPDAAARREAPAATRETAPPSEGGPAAVPGNAPGGHAPDRVTHRSEPKAAPAALLRRASLHRVGRWLRCEVVLRGSVEAKRVRCRLFRNGRLVAHAGAEVTDGRAAVRLEAAHRLAASSYTLVVTAIHPDGPATSERCRVNVR
jgi:uncharacterized protein DUF6916